MFQLGLAYGNSFNSLSFLARYHIPPWEAGLMIFVKFFILTLHHTRPSFLRWGAFGVEQQCHPGLKA